MRFIFFFIIGVISISLQAQVTLNDRNIVDDNRMHDVFTFGDLDGNGTEDIIRVSSERNNVCFLGNKKLVWASGIGDGSFGADIMIKEYVHDALYTGSRIWEIEAHDYDNDGDIDLTVAVRYITPDPQFPNFFLDVYVVEFLENNGDGTFQNSVEIIKTDTLAVNSTNMVMESFDFENDGDLDVVLMARHRMYQTRQLSNGNFSNATWEGLNGSNIYHDLKQTDFNNDGFTDLLARNDGSSAIILLPNINGVMDFTDNSYHLLVDSVQSFDTGDINSDGFVDLIILKNDSLLYTHLNTGSSGYTNNFGSETSIQYSGTPPIWSQTTEIVAIDVDDDGNSDLVYSNNSIHGTLIKFRWSFHRCSNCK